MKINNTYECENCNQSFTNEFQCLEHEKECGVLHKHVCDKCGKETLYSEDDHHPKWYLKNEVWTLRPNHYRAGCGSKMDGSEFVIDICDDCLYEFIKSCVNEKKLLNSGSNAWDCDINEYYSDFLDEEESGYHLEVDLNRQQMNLCNGTGQIGYAVDIEDYCPCPGCEACENDEWKLGEEE